MLWSYYHEIPPEENYLSSLQTNFMHYSSTLVRLRVRISPTKPLLTGQFPSNMRFILFVCGIYRNRPRYGNEVLSSTTKWWRLFSCKRWHGSSFLPSTQQSSFSIVTSFYHLVLDFIEKCIEYSSVLWIANTASAKQCILWYAIKDRWLTFSESTLFIGFYIW